MRGASVQGDLHQSHETGRPTGREGHRYGRGSGPMTHGRQAEPLHEVCAAFDPVGGFRFGPTGASDVTHGLGGGDLHQDAPARIRGVRFDRDPCGENQRDGPPTLGRQVLVVPFLGGEDIDGDGQDVRPEYQPELGGNVSHMRGGLQDRHQWTRPDVLGLRLFFDLNLDRTAAQHLEADRQPAGALGDQWDPRILHDLNRCGPGDRLPLQRSGLGDHPKDLDFVVSGQGVDEISSRPHLIHGSLERLTAKAPERFRLTDIDDIHPFTATGQKRSGAADADIQSGPFGEVLPIGKG